MVIPSCLSPYGEIAWVEEARIGGDHEFGSFVDTDCIMRVKGIHPTRGLIHLGTGFNACCCGGSLLLSAGYNAEIGHHYTAHRLHGELVKAF